MKISREESVEMRQESAALGIMFNDTQWQRVIRAVEERLTRFERISAQELAEKKAKVRERFEQKLDQLLGQSECAKADEIQKRVKDDSSGDPYQDWVQQHLDPPKA